MCIYPRAIFQLILFACLYHKIECLQCVFNEISTYCITEAFSSCYNVCMQYKFKKIFWGLREQQYGAIITIDKWNHTLISVSLACQSSVTGVMPSKCSTATSSLHQAAWAPRLRQTVSWSPPNSILEKTPRLQQLPLLHTEPGE